MTNPKAAGTGEIGRLRMKMDLRTTLTWRQRSILGWGKVRRFYLAHVRPDYVRTSLARRVGDCNRTGACCRLMFTCPILVTEPAPEPVRCGIHERKPKVCRLFPIDERDLRDRDIISPTAPCGYSFTPPAGTPAQEKSRETT